MTGYIGKATNRNGDINGTYAQTEAEAQWGNMNGTIVSFDPATQTATIQPSYRPTHNGEKIDMPELLEVPVRMPRGGNGAMTFPVQAGDKVRLSPMMRASEDYHTGDDDSAGNWARYSDISDMEASLEGGDSLTDPITNYDSENVHVRFSPDGSYGIRGSKDGKIKIEGAQGNIYELIADFMDLVADDGLNIKTGSSIGTGIHELENKSELMAIAAKIRAMAL